MKKRIALLETNKLFLSGLHSQFILNGDSLNISAFENADSFLDDCKSFGLVIIDFENFKMDIETLIMKIKGENEEMKFVVLIRKIELFYVLRLFYDGVQGFVFKSERFEALRATVRSVLSGKKRIPKNVMSVIVDAYEKSSVIRDVQFGFECLTARERQILKLICLGLTNEQMSETLFISKRTVEFHRANLGMKIGTSNSIDQMLYAIRNKLISLNDIMESRAGGTSQIIEKQQEILRKTYLKMGQA